MKVHDALRSVPIFADLDEATIRLIADRARFRTFASGKYLLQERAEGMGLYVLLDGKVSVQRQTPVGKTILIAIRGPGDHFGEMSLLDERGHSADVVAVVDCRTLVVSREAFLQIVQEQPSVALGVIRTLTARLREQTGDLTRARSLDLMGKLCAMILDLADAQGILQGITQQQLANGTGSSREAVNRTLQALRELGYISQGRGVIRILDREGLARRADEPSTA